MRKNNFGLTCRVLIFFAALALGLSATATASAPSLKLVSNGTYITDLVIGQDLEVVLLNGDPNTNYSVRLRDEFGQSVAVTSIQTDNAGHSASTLLWVETGIVGCDPWFTPDPLNYFFTDLLDAETHLLGRKFKVSVMSGNQTVVAKRFEFAVDDSEAVAYVSDDLGCVRHVFYPSDPLHVSFVYPPAVPEEYWIYVADTQGGVWATGNQIIDVSSNGPDWIVISDIQSLWTIDIGIVPGIGIYDIILRKGVNQSMIYDSQTDIVLGREIAAMDARTMKPCSIYCPPP